MDIFNEGTPFEKWKEIIFNASPTLVSIELESLLRRLAVCEALLENAGIDVESASMQYLQENAKAAQDSLYDIAIVSMGNILGNYE